MKGVSIVLAGVFILIVAMASFILASVYKDVVFSFPVISFLIFGAYELLLVVIALGVVSRGMAVLDTEK